jgi:Phage protein (N4 Gp49/phage Sf6 gene 66) family
MNEQQLEQEIVDKKLNAPHITPAGIGAIMANSTWQFHQFPGTQVTVCCISLPNGFNLVGESACVHPANFDREIGEKLAYINARNKLWAFEGYWLAESLHRQKVLTEMEAEFGNGGNANSNASGAV